MYSQNDVNELYAIANQCATYGGNAVYQSRNLLMAIENRVIYFIENCDEINNQNNDRSANVIKQVSNRVRLFPNPNNGNMTIEYSLLNNSDLEIRDVLGKLVYANKLDSNNSKINITENVLKEGVYFYTIKNNDTILFNDKFIIIK